MTDDQIIDLIYLLLGITISDIPRAIVQLFVDEYQVIYPGDDGECQVLYNTTISVYQYLIRSANANATSGRRKEKKGRREIELENVNKASTWQAALTSFIKAPWLTFVQCRDIIAKNLTSRITIGGTKKDEVERVQDNSNSFNQYSETSPFSPTTPGSGTTRTTSRSATNVTGFTLK